MIKDLDSGFPLPQQRVTGKTIDFSPRAVEDWLAALPSANLESAANKILHTLFTINRLEIETGEKLRFLNAIYDACHGVLDQLHRRLDNVPAPPSAGQQRLGEFVIRLHYEFALAYRGTLADKNRSPASTAVKILRHRTMPADSQVLALNRAFFHLRGVLRAGYQINTNPAEHIWAKIYALYFYAREKGLLEQAARTLPNGDPERVENAFKSIILLYFSTPLSLRGQELAGLCDLLPDLASHTRLIPLREVRGSSACYLIGMMTATAPVVEPGTDCAGCTYRDLCLELDISPLVPQLRLLLDLAVSGGALVHHRRLLSTLEAHFGPRRGPRPARIAGQVEVEVIAGLKDVYAFLTPELEKPGPTPATAPSRREMELERARDIVAALENPGNPVGYQMVLDLKQARLEPQIEPPTPFRSSPEQRVVPRRILCKSMNFSSGGYCLYIDKPGQFRLDVGELIAVREVSGERWVPGTVAWLSGERERLQFGVHLLAPHLAAGRAFCDSGDADQSAECLLLFETADTRNPSRILMSPRCLASGQSIHVRRGEQEHDLLLTRELSKTHGYVEFRCEERMALDDSDATVPLFPGMPENPPEPEGEQLPYRPS